MSSRVRITIRKWNGDDELSWAVFVDGKVTYNGLSRREAAYYRDLARKEKGFK